MNWIERIQEEIQSNLEFLRKFTVDEILKLVKDYALHALPFIGDEDETIIKEAGNYKVEYTDGEFRKLELWLPLSKQDYNVVLNTTELMIETCGHYSERVCSTPLIMLYKFSK